MSRIDDSKTQAFCLDVDFKFEVAEEESLRNGFKTILLGYANTGIGR